MVWFKTHKIKFAGDFPDDPIAHRTLIDSGYLQKLADQFLDMPRYNIKGKSEAIFTNASKNVDAQLSAGIIEQASEIVWGEKRRCQGVQRTLLELMQNTNNHAGFSSQGEIHWWLSVDRRQNGIVSFCFVDFGVGVITSLKKKGPNSKFFGWAAKLIRLYQYKSNAELLRLILEGKLHESIMDKYYRGKGFPGIHEALRRNQLSNLFVITNDVFADVSNNDIRDLPCNFTGTFVYWELDAQNVNCHA
jgi:hypothetical protein